MRYVSRMDLCGGARTARLSTARKKQPAVGCQAPSAMSAAASSHQKSNAGKALAMGRMLGRYLSAGQLGTITCATVGTCFQT